MALATVAGALVVAPPNTAAAAPAYDDEVAQELAATAVSLAQGSMLPDLLPVIPGLEANAAMLLGFHEMFIGNADEGIPGLIGILSSTDLAADLPALSDGGLTFGDYADELASGGLRRISFTVAVDRTISVPVTIVEDNVQILGAPVTIDVDMPATTITAEFDPADVAGTFALVDLPTFAVTVALDTDQEIPIQFGFAEATAAGSLDVNFTVELALTDPDGLDRITKDELTTLAVDDLIQLAFPDNGTNDLDVDLSLSADVFGTTFGGQLTITDENLFQGDPADIGFEATGDNPIDLLTNISADTAITALAQLVSSFGAAMLAGDVDLPFLSDGVFIPGDLGVADAADFDRVFQAIQPLIDYVEPRSSGQIVCGTEVGPDPDGEGVGVEGLPTGALIDLAAGQSVFCRTYTSVDGSAQWRVGGAAVGGASTTSVGTAPSTNVELEAGAGGAFAVSLDFTPGDGSGTIPILPRPATVQALLLELADAGLIPSPGGVPDFGYESDVEAFTFPFEFGVTDPIERTATINAGNSLVADTGITGLSAGATATASYSIDDITAGATLGLIVTEGTDADPISPLDRFYLSGVDSLLEVGTVTLDGNFDMVGRLGFLEVEANVAGELSKPVGADSALKVGLDGSDITVNGTTVPDAILVADVLSPTLVSHVSADVNLAFNGSATVSADAAGLGASGGFNIAWDLDDPAPTISGFDAGFTNTLLPFGGSLSLVHDGPPAADPTLFTGTSAVNLLATPGLVGSQLVDDDGNVCNITAVLSATQLNCSSPDGDVLNPITFAAGASYDVEGNTLSGLAQILAALDALVEYLEVAVGSDAFDTPIDLIGVSPADIVAQVGELRRMVDEFRGIQDATIQCAVVGDAAADIRAIPLDLTPLSEEPPGTVADVAIKCAAEAFVTNPSGVQWRLVPAGSDPGAFVADADQSSLSGTPDPAVSGEQLAVAASLDTDGDGFVSIGSEYSVEVEWSDATGDHQAAFPPRIPQSLQKLETLINETLGLPEGLVHFELDTGAEAPADPTLKIEIGYGICSTESFIDECDGLPTGPRPSANLNFDLSGAGLGDLVGLDVTGTIDVDYAALGQFDIGVPLDGSAPVLYGSTGIEARLQAEGSADLAVDASIGPVSALVGASATGVSGSAEADSADGTLHATGAFTTANVSVGMVITRTGDGGACVVTARTDDDHVQCDLEWTEGDAFRLGGRNDLSAGLALELQLTDAADAVVGDNDFVTFGDAGVDVTDPGEILSGGSCGPIVESTMDQISGSTVTADERNLGGFACAQLSLAADLAGTTTYLGELDVELLAAADPVRAWAPGDLGTRLEAALLNPAFLLQLLPDLLEAIEGGMRDAADSGLPATVADPLRTGADGIEATRLVVEGALDSFAAELAGLTPGGTLEAKIDTELTELLGLAGDDAVVVTAQCDHAGTVEDCVDGDALLSLRDVRAVVNLGKMVSRDHGCQPRAGGSPAERAGRRERFANWDITVGLGVNMTDGPYVALERERPGVPRRRRRDAGRRRPEL